MKKTGLGLAAFLFVGITPACAQYYAPDAQPVGNSGAVNHVVVNEPLAYPADAYPSAQGHYLSNGRGAAAIATPAPAPVYGTYPSAPVATSVQTAPQAPVYVTPAYTAAVATPAATYQQPTQPMNAASNYPTAYGKSETAATKILNQNMGLGTLNGFEFGLQGSNYRYQEHDTAGQTFMNLDGWNGGLTVTGNKVFSDGTFIGGDVRGAYGKVDYKGSDQYISGRSTPSKQNNESDYLAEGRALIGHDFIFDHQLDFPNFSISPYTGVGIRFLYNDATGTDSNNVSGYGRYSHYIYLPAGLTSRFRLSEKSRISLNGEYDQLLYGWQISSLGDASPGGADLQNNQHDGYGLRGSLMYDRTSWSVGPFFDYWNVNQSKTGCAAYNNIFIGCGVEPHNQTIEYGLQARYRTYIFW